VTVPAGVEEARMMRPLLLADLRVTSPDLVADGPIADRFSGYHEEQTPTLVVTGLPAGTVELALVCHDPDAPRPSGFTHWVVFGIPAEEGVTVGPDAAERYRLGPNSRGERSWAGPRPPAGHGLHRYYFWVYALARPVDGAPSRDQFLVRHGDDVIEQARLVGTYERQREPDGSAAEGPTAR
jgi:Raf kinase inhibitor-like YbhB/YbcL family protein